MNGLSKKVLGSAYVYEDMGMGYYRVISENGDVSILRSGQLCGGFVGDNGKIVYCSDGATYGLRSFVPDKSVSINLTKLQDNYNKRWNSNICIKD